MNYKSYAGLSDDIFNNLDKVQYQGFELIVGIPRSGMIPAYMLSLFLNIDCTSLHDFIRNSKLAKGNTRSLRKEICNAWDAKKVLIVDDSVNTGASMEEVLDQIPEDCPCEITTLAVYGNAVGMAKVDVCLKYLSSPRVFQWNIWHHNVLQRACIALDGVIFNGLEEHLDKEENGMGLIQEVRPLVIPTYRINSLITKQHERYRKEIESWLSYYNITYDNLIMSGSVDKNETRSHQEYCKLKADYYKQDSRLYFFVESDFDHAVFIAKATGKSVFCTQANDLVRPSVREIVKHGKAYFFRINLARMRRVMKRWLPSL
ncbi:Hypoxanthine phosphoribosyltransferase [Modicisalibacter ilicicola DSM 19980]|uniref:Hypoxanthine phosphoribosyltransferase n=1 Tax=Modicisalibacter ilicicola DSM 19980 TaxID=1121942 RepID=A0A1M4SUM7_9GAMM|nr:Hypoxanthine phosphoribosyltransferase [Halomonas ilicicola DSM 19980]